MLVSIGSNHGIAALSSCTGRQRCLGNHDREYFKVTTSTHHIWCTHWEGQRERWRGQVHVKYNSFMMILHTAIEVVAWTKKYNSLLWWFYLARAVYFTQVVELDTHENEMHECQKFFKVKEKSCLIPSYFPPRVIYYL